MADLVIDEWLWADLCGDNSSEAQNEAFRFIQAVFKKCDRIVSVQGSGFAQKALQFWKNTDVKRRQIAKYYKAHFWYNSKKSLNLEESILKPVPEIIAKVTKQDDHYLIQAYITVEANVVVTTDHPLKEALEQNGIPCKHRNDFIQSYIHLKSNGVQKDDDLG